MNDIIIHGTSKEEHDARLKCVQEKIKHCGLVLNREKCVFNMPELVCYGLCFIGIGPAENKVKAINDAREPRTADEVRSFFG